MHKRVSASSALFSTTPIYTSYDMLLCKFGDAMTAPALKFSVPSIFFNRD